jgi:hypothetical protein
VAVPFVIYWILLLLFLFTAGCQLRSSSTPFSTAPGEPEMTPTPPTPVDSNLESLIEKAKTDLARRLSIPANDIVLMEATSVTWPDSSLGCPQEGMFYTQVLTDGYLIRLEANGKIYEYHANRDAHVFLCENPASPVSGSSNAS